MRLILASLVLGVLGAASPGWAADPVVGAVYSTSPAGQNARDAVATALDIINGTHEPVAVLMGHGGGLERFGGAKLAVAFADDADDAAKATAAAEHLVTDEHAIALIGGLSDATAAAISKVAEAHGLPFLALNSALANEAGLSWFFRLGRTPALDARAILQLLGGIASAHGKTLQTVALLFEDSPAGRDRTTPIRTAAATAGLKVVDFGLPAGAALPPDIMVTLTAAAPDAVLAFRDPGDLVAQGIGPVVLMQPGEGAGSAEGLFRSVSFTSNLLPARPGVSVVDSAFKARTGRPLDATTAREINGVLLLADVIDRAGSTKPMDLRTALMATDTQPTEMLMLWQGIRFDDSGQNVLATPALQQMQGGVFKTVAPEAVATAEPTWPAPR